jgi:hypothetical protein
MMFASVAFPEGRNQTCIRPWPVREAGLGAPRGGTLVGEFRSSPVSELFSPKKCKKDERFCDSVRLSCDSQGRLRREAKLKSTPDLTEYIYGVALTGARLDASTSC